MDNETNSPAAGVAETRRLLTHSSRTQKNGSRSVRPNLLQSQQPSQQMSKAYNVLNIEIPDYMRRIIEYFFDSSPPGQLAFVRDCCHDVLLSALATADIPSYLSSITTAVDEFSASCTQRHAHREMPVFTIGLAAATMAAAAAAEVGGVEASERSSRHQSAASESHHADDRELPSSLTSLTLTSAAAAATGAAAAAQTGGGSSRMNGGGGGGGVEEFKNEDELLKRWLGCSFVISKAVGFLKEGDPNLWYLYNEGRIAIQLDEFYTHITEIVPLTPSIDWIPLSMFEKLRNPYRVAMECLLRLEYIHQHFPSASSSSSSSSTAAAAAFSVHLVDTQAAAAAAVESQSIEEFSNGSNKKDTDDVLVGAARKEDELTPYAVNLDEGRLQNKLTTMQIIIASENVNILNSRGGAWKSLWETTFNPEENNSAVVVKFKADVKLQYWEECNSCLVKSVKSEYLVEHKAQDPQFFSHQLLNVIHKSEELLQENLNNFLSLSHFHILRSLRRLTTIGCTSFDWTGFQALMAADLNKNTILRKLQSYRSNQETQQPQDGHQGVQTEQVN